MKHIFLLPAAMGASLLLAASSMSCGVGSPISAGGAGGGLSNGPGGPGGPGDTTATTAAFMSGSTGTQMGCESCSSDLHNVIDCAGNVIMTCPDDQGCSPNGTCVPACQSAEENKSTIGCDFFSVTPAVITESRGSCFAAMVANTWTSPISITAEYAGQTIDAAPFTFIPQGQGASLTYAPLPNGQLPPGQLGIVFLSEYPSGDIFQINCPVQPWLNTSTQVSIGTYQGDPGFGNAFHLATTAPIVAYDVYPWGGASSFVTSATLLLPTPTWGTNFVTADGWGPLNGYPFTQIVAAQDNTSVTMVPVANLSGLNGSPGGAANTPVTFNLNRGQMVQFVQPERLVGSALQSDKPVSVWGGGTCMNIPDNYVACDAAHQQLLPVQALGHTYVGARYPSRGGDDSAPYMLVGTVAGTNLVWDPAPPPGAPSTLTQGQMVTFFTDGNPFSVSSQDKDHPFYMATYMTGAQSNPEDLGDPEYVNVVPPDQFLSSYLFVTDPTYADTSLVFVRRKAADGMFKDVTLDCIGTLTGWQPVGSGGNYEMVRPMLVDHFTPVGNCNNGVHTASSTEPFGLTAWGYDSAASYGYPGGMSVKPINTVVVPPIPQ